MTIKNHDTACGYFHGQALFDIRPGCLIQYFQLAFATGVVYPIYLAQCRSVTAGLHPETTGTRRLGLTGTIP